MLNKSFFCLFFFQKKVQAIKIGTLIKALSRLCELQVSDSAEHKQTQWKTCLIAWRDNNIIPPVLPTFVNRLRREFDRNTNNLSNSRRRSELFFSLLVLLQLHSSSLSHIINNPWPPGCQAHPAQMLTNQDMFLTLISPKNLNISLFPETSRELLSSSSTSGTTDISRWMSLRYIASHFIERGCQ